MTLTWSRKAHWGIQCALQDCLSKIRIRMSARAAQWRASGHLISPPALTISQVKWLTIIAPPLLIGAFEFVRHNWLPDEFLPMWAGNLVVTGLVMLGTLMFSRLVFGIIENITRENERRREEAEALFDVGTQITALLDREQVLQSIVEQARRLLATDVATIGLVQDDNPKSIQLVATSGMTLDELNALRRQVGHDLPVEQAIHTGRPSFDELPAQTCNRVRCRLAVPLILGRRVIGSLCVGSRQGTHFSADEVRLLTRLANQAAIAIENARLQAQAQQIATVEERERLVRELHDGLGQTLSYLALKTDVIQDHLQMGRMPQAQAELARIAKVTRDAAGDVRESILGLKASLNVKNWMEALQEYLIRYRELNGIATELIDDSRVCIALTDNSQIQLLRIVQEILVNVRKHSRARKVVLRVSVREDELRVAVKDDGKGFDLEGIKAAGGAHFGLMIMRERARLLGGHVQIESQPGEGTYVVVQVPLSRNGRNNGSSTHPHS